MSVLLRAIKDSDKEAASVLEKADFRTDSEIKSLTREDLNELFPGIEKLKLRKKIFEIIHKRKPTDVLLRELKDFIPHESLKAALTNNGVLVDYLHILKEMKTQMKNVQDFLDGHIGLLEEFTKNQNQEPNKGSLADTGTSENSGPVVPNGGQTERHPQGAQGTDISKGHNQLMPFTGQAKGDFLSVVRYQKVVSGKNFGADTQLMDKVKAQNPGWVQLIESNQDYKIIIVFCTISSRVGSDVEAAMYDLKGDEHVILVLMHHSREAKNTFHRTWPEYPKVVLQVNVFFHEILHGLVKCHQNDEAASMIQKKLIEYSVQERKDTSGNALGVDCDSGVTRPATGGGGFFRSYKFF